MWDASLLLTCGRSILRTLFKGVQVANYGEEDITICYTKENHKTKTQNRRPGTPKLRWEDNAVVDAKKLGVVNWKITAQDRVVWRGKVVTGLWS